MSTLARALATIYGINRFINGAMQVDQRNSGAAQTITAAAALAYTVDRWYAYCTGANVTGQRVAGSGQSQYMYQFTGAASVTGIGFAQRIEQINSYDLAGQTATLAVDLANTLLTTVTWTAYYATTADTFGTLASPTKTQIATGSFTVSGSVKRYATRISIPSAATTGVEVVFSVGAQTSGTWAIGNAKIEAGNLATPVERREVGDVLRQCQRYFEAGGIVTLGYWGTTASAYGQPVTYKVTKRASPTVVFSRISQGGVITSAATAVGSGIDRTDGFTAAYTTSGAGAFNSNETYTSSAEL